MLLANKKPAELFKPPVKTKLLKTSLIGLKNKTKFSAQFYFQFHIFICTRLSALPGTKFKKLERTQSLGL